MPTMPAQARDFGRGCCPGGKPGIHRRHSPISGKWPGGMSSVAVLGGGSAGGGCTGGGGLRGGGLMAAGGVLPRGGVGAGGGHPRVAYTPRRPPPPAARF